MKKYLIFCMFILLTTTILAQKDGIISVVGIKKPATVSKINDSVWTGEDISKPLSKLLKSDKTYVPAYVTTDRNGEALISLRDNPTCQIYLMRTSNLVTAPCGKAGGATCSTGMVRFQNCRFSVSFETPTGTVQFSDIPRMAQINGFSQNQRLKKTKKLFEKSQTIPSQLAYLLYIPKTQLTVVIVKKGSALVTSVTDFDNGSLGSSENISEDHIWFSAPDFIQKTLPDYVWNDQRKSLPISDLFRIGRNFDFSDRVTEINQVSVKILDKTPPRITLLTIQALNREDSENDISKDIRPGDTIVFEVDAEDDTGLDYLEIRFNDKKVGQSDCDRQGCIFKTKIPDDYDTDIPLNYQIQIFDRAGNYTLQSGQIKINPPGVKD